MNFTLRSIFVLVFSLQTLMYGVSQVVLTVDMLKDSYLAINGSSNIVSFQLAQNIERLMPDKFLVSAHQDNNRVYLNQTHLSIPVRNFYSDNKMALKDFLKLLKVDSYPDMEVDLKYIELLPNQQRKSELFGIAYVGITITGKTRLYKMSVSSLANGEIYLIRGSKKINIKDFGLIPPTALMGLLQVSEWIDIDYLIRCKIGAKDIVAAQFD